MRGFKKSRLFLNDQRGQDGAASLYVAISVTVVLFLVAITFAGLMTTNAQEDLETRLTTQALYAAEVGLRDAREMIKNDEIDTYKWIKEGNCHNPEPQIATLSSDGTATEDGSVKYSCLSIDMMPDDLYYDKVNRNRPLNMWLQPYKHHNQNVEVDMHRLDIKWRNTTPDGEPPSANYDTSGINPALSFPNIWDKGASVLKIQMTFWDPAKAKADGDGDGSPDGYNRDDVLANTRVFYLYPTQSSATNDLINWGSASGSRQSVINGLGVRALETDIKKQGQIFKANCKANDYCYASVVGLPSSQNNRNNIGSKAKMFISITPLYDETFVSLQGYFSRQSGSWGDANDDDTAGRPLQGEWDNRVVFKDLQAVLSATGTAGHVKKRLTERMPLRPNFDSPVDAIVTADDLCKVLIGDQDSGTDNGIPDVDDDNDGVILVTNQRNVAGADDEKCNIY